MVHLEIMRVMLRKWRHETMRNHFASVEMNGLFVSCSEKIQWSQLTITT